MKMIRSIARGGVCALCAALLSACVAVPVAPVRATVAVQVPAAPIDISVVPVEPPVGLAYVAPIGVAPGLGFTWSFNPVLRTWAWWHPGVGWYHPSYGWWHHANGWGYHERGEWRWRR